MDGLSTGEKIAGGSAVLLFIFMFFDWFKVDVSSGNGLFSISVGGSAWEAFSYTDLFLMLTIIVAVAVSVLLIVYRIIDPPGDTGGVPGVDINPAIGAFLGLIAAAGLTYGAYRAMQEEGTSFGEIGDQFSNRGGSGPTQPPSSTPPSPPPPPPSN